VVTADVQERAQQAGPAPVLLVDVHAAARMLGLGRCTILALADDGELPRLRFGRAVRFAVGDIEHLVERRRSATQVPAEAAGIFRLSPGDQQHLSQAGSGVTAALTSSGPETPGLVAPRRPTCGRPRSGTGSRCA